MEDKSVVANGGGEEDVFGFQSAVDDLKEKKGKEKAAPTANPAKEKAEAHKTRIEEEKEDVRETSDRKQSRKAQAKEPASEVEDTSKPKKTAVNGRKRLEEQLEQLNQADQPKQQQERGDEVEEEDAKTEPARSRLPGRKRLNIEQRKEDEEEEEYEPPPTAPEKDEVKEVTPPPPPADKKRASRDAAKAQKSAPPTKPAKPVGEQQPQPIAAKKGRTRAKQSVTPSSTSEGEEKESNEEDSATKAAGSTSTRPSSAGRKSARAQRKEQLKAKDAVSPVKPRPSRRTTTPVDDEADSVPDSNRPIRSTRKRSAPHSNDTSAVDSDESSSSSAKRTRVSTTAVGAPAATAAADNKYRFAIASKGSMSAEKAASLREMIEQLGAECIDDGDDYSLCSAVVIKDSTQLKRTEKVLAAIVAGLPIVPRSYIEASSEKGDFLQPSSYRFKKDDMDDTGRVLMRAAARWKHKQPFKGWAVYIADSTRARMLTNILGMGGGTMESDVSECNHCLVSTAEAGCEAVMKRMWNAGVPVYRSELVVEYICYSDPKEWAEWDMDEFKLTKDNWKSAWSNPWKDSSHSSQSTHGTEGVETEGKRKRRS